MCWPTDVVRRLLGIRDYVPGAYPHARVRKPTWHGSRTTNGHAPGLAASVDPVVATLAREHRQIRQMLADAARWARRRDAP